MSPTFIRRCVLVTLVLAAASHLPGCGVTAYQRMWDSFDALNSPEMNAAIAAAKPGVPR